MKVAENTIKSTLYTTSCVYYRIFSYIVYHTKDLIMFKQLTIAVLFVSTTATAQDSIPDQLSVDLQIGLNNPVNPIASTYDARTLGPFHTAGSVRYMFNPKFGARIQANYDQFTNRSGTTAFSTNYFRASLEGVINVGNLFNFHDWTKRFGLLVHGGVGYSVMKEKSWAKTPDNMIHIVGGITPQFKVNNRWVILLDMTSLAHIYQSRTYDFSEANIKRGIDGYLLNLSVGVQFYFGHGTHADWVISHDLNQELINLDQRMADLKLQQGDDDHDGVANYLDMEPNTAPDAVVNTKGVTQTSILKDSDSDGISDDMDECPFAKGSVGCKGCPDRDEDGIADKIDECPLIPGTIKSNGCPDIAPETIQTLQKSGKSVVFAREKSVLPTVAHADLDEVAKLILANPDYLLVVSVHSSGEGENLHNLELTEYRANAIRDYLVTKGVAHDRIVALGFGETQPVADKTTKEGNILNERVELSIRFK